MCPRVGRRPVGAHQRKDYAASRIPYRYAASDTTLLTLAEGTSIITEGVWEQRFRYVDELRRMGADISVDGKVAVVEGTGKLTGAPVKACDLRAGAALIIAGLAAHGITEIEDIYHIERGYANLDAKLREIGADIQKVSFPAAQAELKEAL